jgi:hypothetical protein
LLRTAVPPEVSSPSPRCDAAGVDSAIAGYLDRIAPVTGEAARSQLFTALLETIFGLQARFLEDHEPDAERYVRVRHKDTVLVGAAENLFGNVIVEVESDLRTARRLDEAQVQLRRYLACLWSAKPPARRERFLCLATDGVRFAIYAPSVLEPDRDTIVPLEVSLVCLDRLDAGQMGAPRDLHQWLDRHLCRQAPLPATPASILSDFGPRSYAFQSARQRLSRLWDRQQQRSDFRAVRAVWGDYLAEAYGGQVGDDELFIGHTYLSAVLRMAAWARFWPPAPLTDALLRDIVQGSFFREQGLDNFLCADVFGWPFGAESNGSLAGQARSLAGHWRSYALAGLTGAPLQALYAQMAEPWSGRDPRLGPAPSWLAQRMVGRLLDSRPTASLLDPCCGTGTYLVQAIAHKRRVLGDTPNTLAHIQQSVMGMDVHPLAAPLAQVSYLLALGELVALPTARLSVPVYLGNALRTAEFNRQAGMDLVAGDLRAQSPGYRLDLDGEAVVLPEAVVLQPGLYDEAVDAVCLFAARAAGHTVDEALFEGYLRDQYPALASDPAVPAALFAAAEVLRSRLQARRGGIWSCVLRNGFRTLLLRSRFDVVVSSLPWLPLERVQQPEYQEFLLTELAQTHRLVSGRPELTGQVDLAALFAMRTASLYLRAGGAMGCVLPRQVLTAEQYGVLRQGACRGLSIGWTELWDLGEVAPLAPGPACVLFGVRREDKGGRQAREDDLAGQTVTGRLPRNDAVAAEAADCLTWQDVRFQLARRGARTIWTEVAGTSHRLPGLE